jgi:uncharacterized membrane protein YbaN (DUF454 family)
MLRILLIGCGWTSVGLAGLGMVLPLLPTTPFLLLAAACFARSSPRARRWLVRHHWSRTILRAWKRGEGLPRRAKVAVLLFTWTGLGISMAWGIPHELGLLRWSPLAIGAGVTWYVARPPAKRTRAIAATCRD